MMNLRILVILFLSLSHVLSCGKTEKTSLPVKDAVPCLVVRVSDGDTFHCTMPSGDEVKVRLIGVDTPESSDNPKARKDAERSNLSVEEIIKMGKLSAEFTKRHLPKGTKVYLEFDVQKTDRYGRLLAYVWLSDGSMLNELLIREGYAQVYTVPPNVKYQERFLQAQRYAKENKKGLWGM